MSPEKIEEVICSCGASRDALRKREAAENAPHVARAKETGRAQTFIASDGCEVTCFPDGRVAFNMADWY